MEKQNDQELDIEVKGYGCDTDCREFFPMTEDESMGCGWDDVDNTWPLW